MNPIAIIPSNTAASCKRPNISSRFSSMTYSEPGALLARRYSLKNKLGTVAPSLTNYRAKAGPNFIC
jgi:hypothetical protein